MWRVGVVCCHCVVVVSWGASAGAGVAKAPHLLAHLGRGELSFRTPESPFVSSKIPKRAAEREGGAARQASNEHAAHALL